MDRMSLLFVAAASAIVAPAEAVVAERWQAHIAEASQRFGVPEAWIRAVIDAESKGDPRAVSPKGAMGLMQLMPATWEELRAQHKLGADPFEPRANILAGAAYLKSMRERFGYPGLFAAYNAGPARYEEHLRTGKPLPEETRAYLAGLEKALSNASRPPVVFASRGATSRASGAGKSPRLDAKTRLFFPLSTAGNDSKDDKYDAPLSELFVPLSTRKPSEN
ncbi:lytic transglycosylase domain-containing protein [Methylocystis sp. JAN1]|jgi:soluble lytic murein transglycosylase-like protein|uniref:lytic transglycosylase domain-containing protein n=1 Tax=Methylocystis sp. JAN1 TaxID=3397211 RepID=UPI003FA219AB